MDLIVCPSASLAETCRRHQPERVLTFASPGAPVPALHYAAEHLVLAFNDIVRATAGLVAPDRKSIAAVIDFGRRWDGERPCVVQCELGVSRSPAAAFIIACAKRPASSEREIATSLRAVSPVATPNALMVSLADDLLGRKGRMVAAIAEIGRGADYQPYGSFGLTVRCPAPV